MCPKKHEELWGEKNQAVWCHSERQTWDRWEPRENAGSGRRKDLFAEDAEKSILS